MLRHPGSSSLFQRGAAATEFAMVSIIFLAMVIAVIEFARLMYIYSTAIEATRLGARLAVVCSVNDEAKVKAKMKAMLNLLEPGNIIISYPAGGCSATTCPGVTVRIQGLTVSTSIPLAPLSFPIPSYSTTLPAESLDSTNNPVCN